MTTPLTQKQDAATQQIAREAADKWLGTGEEPSVKSHLACIILSAIERATEPRDQEKTLRELLQEMIDCYVSVNDLPPEYVSKLKDAIKVSEMLPAQPQPSKNMSNSKRAVRSDT